MENTPSQILVVEDSTTQAKWLRMLLEQQGFQVQTAINGKEALRLLADWLPDVIVTDIVMPEMDGFTLCRTVKADERLKRIPVILLTTLSDRNDVLSALKCGADNFVTKPYNPEFLVDRVRAAHEHMQTRGLDERDEELESVLVNGETHEVPSRLSRIIPLLLSTYEEAANKNRELNESLQTIRALEADYRSILEANADGVVVCDLEGTVQFANPAAATLLGKSTANLVNDAFGPALEPGSTTEQELVTASGELIVVEMSVVETHWERNPALLASLRDVTDKVQMRNRLKSLAYNDELTGLRNRRGFTTLGSKQLEIARRRGDPVVLFYLDLDGLKWINDNLGHQEGDQALADMAGVLATVFRHSDIIARLGGDEFAVIALDVAKGLHKLLAGRLQRAIDTHNATAGRSYTLAASVGCVVWDSEIDATLDDLLTRGDEEMYEVKRKRKAAKETEPA